MQLLIYGPGRLGRAIAAAAVDAGWPEPDRIGRPDPGGERPPVLADVVIDASVAGAVADNVTHALAAGNRAFILATTGWDADADRVHASLAARGATAVAAPNLSLGAAVYLRLVETAAGWYARTGSFEPSIVEWHRRGKADRPSGTARELARRIVAADPRWAAGDAAPRSPARPAATPARRSRSPGSAPAPHRARTS